MINNIYISVQVCMENKEINALSKLLDQLCSKPVPHHNYQPPPLNAPINYQKSRIRNEYINKTPTLCTEIRFASDQELEMWFGANWKDLVYVSLKRKIPIQMCCEAFVIDSMTGQKRTCRRQYTEKIKNKKRCGLHKCKGICQI